MDLTLTTILDYIGTFAFAISGVRLAAAKNFDLFGAFVVGFVTAVGGGTLRDVMIGIQPFWTANEAYLIITALALVFVIIFRKHVVKLDNTFYFFDAGGLGVFTVVGLERSLAAGLPMWASIIMGCITGAAGGMLRDIFINEVPLIFRKDIYAVACVIGGLIYYICTLLDVPEAVPAILGATTVIVVRLLSLKFGISLPSLRGENEEVEPWRPRKRSGRRK